MSTQRPLGLSSYSNNSHNRTSSRITSHQTAPNRRIQRRNKAEMTTFGPKDHEIITAPPPPVLEMAEQNGTDDREPKDTSKRGRKRSRDHNDDDDNEKKKRKVNNTNGKDNKTITDVPQTLMDCINKSWKNAINDALTQNEALNKEEIKRIKTEHNKELNGLRMKIKQFQTENDKNNKELNDKQDKLKKLEGDLTKNKTLNANNMSLVKENMNKLEKKIESQEIENKKYRKWKSLLTEFQAKQKEKQKSNVIQQEKHIDNHEEQDLGQRIKENEESEEQMIEWMQQIKKVQDKYKKIKKLLKDKRMDNKQLRKERDVMLRKQIEFEKKVNEYKSRIIKTEQKLFSYKEREIGYKNEIHDLNECRIIAEFKTKRIKQEKVESTDDDEDESISDDDDYKM